MIMKMGSAKLINKKNLVVLESNSLHRHMGFYAIPRKKSLPLS